MWGGGSGLDSAQLVGAQVFKIFFHVYSPGILQRPKNHLHSLENSKMLHDAVSTTSFSRTSDWQGVETRRSPSAVPRDWPTTTHHPTRPLTKVWQSTEFRSDGKLRRDAELGRREDAEHEFLYRLECLLLAHLIAGRAQLPGPVVDERDHLPKGERNAHAVHFGIVVAEVRPGKD